MLVIIQLFKKSSDKNLFMKFLITMKNKHEYFEIFNQIFLKNLRFSKFSINITLFSEKFKEII